MAATTPPAPDTEGPSLVASFLALVDDATERLVNHPIRPRVKATPQGLLRGELDVVKVEVPAVLAAGLLIDRLVVRAERVRVTPGLPPHLKAGPVGLRAYVSQANVDRWTRTSHLPIRLALTEEGVLLTTGVAGFVFPGDRVDIVLTQTVTGTQGQPLNASETILRNLRVLATDQSTTQEVVEGKTVVNEVRTVTLEVTPKIAEKIAVAETIGELSLSLRSLADSQSELEQVLARGDIVIPDDATPEEEEKLLREAMARPSDARGSFATGGDVSRFQRSSIPPQTEPQSAARNLEMPQSAPGAPAPAGETRTVPRGPVVRVTRGQQTTEVPVGKSR